MKILVIGATGTIGAAVADTLAANHDVVRASRGAKVKVDIDDPGSIRALFETVSPDAVVCCTGNAKFAPFEKLTDEDYAYGLRSKLMGQVNLARIASRHLREKGSITLTSGALAQNPMPGSAAISLVNAGLEGFVRAAALELPRGQRINVVSPPWVKETMVKLGMDPTPGMAARDVARAYVESITGRRQGETLDARKF